MLDRARFFAHIRLAPFGGTMAQTQVNGVNAILDEWERRKLTELRWLAYMLATVFHETGRAMQPVREGGGEDYLRSKPYYPWVGEGLVQVTWQENARKFGAEKPGDLMSWPIALRALFDGMIGGVFTGKKLADFFGTAVSDPVRARRIINGNDKAELIAGYYGSFMDALHAADILEPPAPSMVSADKPPIRRTEPEVPARQPGKTTAGTAAVGAVVAAGAAHAAGHGTAAWILVVAAVAAVAAFIVLHLRKKP